MEVDDVGTKEPEHADHGGQRAGTESPLSEHSNRASIVPTDGDEVCMKCGSTEDAAKILLCDGRVGGEECPNACHTYCCGRSRVPEGEWLCPDCELKREARKRRIQKEKKNNSGKNRGESSRKSVRSTTTDGSDSGEAPQERQVSQEEEAGDRSHTEQQGECLRQKRNDRIREPPHKITSSSSEDERPWKTHTGALYCSCQRKEKNGKSKNHKHKLQLLPWSKPTIQFSASVKNSISGRMPHPIRGAPFPSILAPYHPVSSRLDAGLAGGLRLPVDASLSGAIPINTDIDVPFILARSCKLYSYPLHPLLEPDSSKELEAERTKRRMPPPADQIANLTVDHPYIAVPPELLGDLIQESMDVEQNQKWQSSLRKKQEDLAGNILGSFPVDISVSGRRAARTEDANRNPTSDNSVQTVSISHHPDLQMPVQQQTPVHPDEFAYLDAELSMCVFAHGKIRNELALGGLKYRHWDGEGPELGILCTMGLESPIQQICVGDVHAQGSGPRLYDEQYYSPGNDFPLILSRCDYRSYLHRPSMVDHSRGRSWKLRPIDSMALPSCLLWGALNTRLGNEAALLRQDGRIDVWSLVSASARQLRSIRLWGGEGPDGNLMTTTNESYWGRCEYAWHPRVLLAAHPTSLYQVDCRVKEPVGRPCTAMDIPTRKPLCGMAVSRQSFEFALATSDDIFLMDARYTRRPVLSWQYHYKEPPRQLSFVDLDDKTRALFAFTGRGEHATLMSFSTDPATQAVYPEGNPVTFDSPNGDGTSADILGCAIYSEKVPSSPSTWHSSPLVSTSPVLANQVPENLEPANSSKLEKQCFSLLKLTPKGSVVIEDYEPCLRPASQRNFSTDHQGLQEQSLMMAVGGEGGPQDPEDAHHPVVEINLTREFTYLVSVGTTLDRELSDATLAESVLALVSIINDNQTQFQQFLQVPQSLGNVLRLLYKVTREGLSYSHTPPYYLPHWNSLPSFSAFSVNACRALEQFVAVGRGSTFDMKARGHPAFPLYTYTIEPRLLFQPGYPQGTVSEPSPPSCRCLSDQSEQAAASSQEGSLPCGDHWCYLLHSKMFTARPNICDLEYMQPPDSTLREIDTAPDLSQNLDFLLSAMSASQEGDTEERTATETTSASEYRLRHLDTFLANLGKEWCEWSDQLRQ